MKHFFTIESLTGMSIRKIAVLTTFKLATEAFHQQYGPLSEVLLFRWPLFVDTDNSNEREPMKVPLNCQYWNLRASAR